MGAEREETQHLPRHVLQGIGNIASFAGIEVGRGAEFLRLRHGSLRWTHSHLPTGGVDRWLHKRFNDRRRSWFPDQFCDHCIPALVYFVGVIA